MNNCIEKVFSVSRKIDSFEIGNGVSAYKDSVYVDGKEYSVCQGITETKNIKADGLCQLTSDKQYLVIPKAFLEKWRTDINVYTSDMILENCYEAMLDPDINVAVIYDSHTGNFFLLDGTVCPKAKPFNYISGNIDNENYDLDSLYTYLLSKPEQFKNVKKEHIPYYNAEEGRDRMVSFIWTPDTESYGELIAQGDDLFREHAKTIIGIEQFRITT